MKITVSHIPPGGFHFQFSEKPDDFPVLADMVQNREIVFTAPVTGEISATVMADDLVEIKGEIRSALTFECGRCLESFEQELSRSFFLNFVLEKNDSERVSDPGDEHEILEKDISTEHYTGDTIELKDAVQEQILLGLPLRPICSEQCKGLCPVCGSNLNQTTCGCTVVKGHPAFAVLKGLKT